MSCRLQLAGEVFTLSAEAAAMSAVIVTMTQRDDDEGDTVPHDVDEAMPLPVECVTARGLSAAVGFMERRGTASTTRARPSVLATPLWFDEGAVPATPWAALGLPDGEEDEALVQDLWRDGGLLVEVARTADFLQVDALLELCCGVLAVAMGQAGRTAMRLDGLSAMVLTKALTLMPTRAKDKALESYAAVRNAVGVFVVERWFADLRAMSREEGGGRRSQQPWLMCPRSMVSVERGDVAMTRLANEVGQYMLERRFVPVGLTAERLAEQLEDVLATTGDLRGAKVGLFSVSVTGPLGAWLPHALRHFDMHPWLALDGAIQHESADIAGLDALAPFSIVTNPDHQPSRSSFVKALSSHLDLQRSDLTRLWRRRDDHVTRVALLPAHGTFIVSALHNERVVIAPMSVDDASRLEVRADRLVVTCVSGKASETFVVTPAEAFMSSRLSFAAHCATQCIKWKDDKQPSWLYLVQLDLALCSRVKEIGLGFASFSGVTAVDMGGWTATTILNNFFATCPSLTSVCASAPCALQVIGDSAFSGCPLTRIDWSNCTNLRKIGTFFCGRTDVTALDLGGWAATDIGAMFFADCRALTSVTASSPCALERIDSSCFLGCTSLGLVDLSNCHNLSAIGANFCLRAGVTGAFFASGAAGDYCSGLSFSDPLKCSKLQRIGVNFFGQSLLTTIDLGGLTVTDLADYFIWKCRALTSVTASAACAIERIGSSAFSDCDALTHLDLSQCVNLRAIGSKFCSRTGLRSLDFAGWTTTEVAEDLLRDCLALVSVTASGPCAIERIAASAFVGCTALTRVDLSQCVNLRAIGASFGSRSAVTSLDLGGWTAAEIAGDFFAECQSLSAVTASAACAIERIGANAFQRCKSLVSVDLSRCTSLCAIAACFCSETGITALDLGGWTATELADNFFAQCRALTSVTASAPCSVTRIDRKAFDGCAALTQVDLTQCTSLLALGPHFCARCGVASLDLGGWSVTDVGENFFAENTSLTSVTASSPCAIERIEAKAFRGCTILTKVDLSGCKKLRAVASPFCPETGVSLSATANLTAKPTTSRRR